MVLTIKPKITKPKIPKIEKIVTKEVKVKNLDGQEQKIMKIDNPNICKLNFLSPKGFHPKIPKPEIPKPKKPKVPKYPRPKYSRPKYSRPKYSRPKYPRLKQRYQLNN